LYEEMEDDSEYVQRILARRVELTFRYKCTPTKKQDSTRIHLRNRKHVPCFYQVIETRVEVWENEKCCENTSVRGVFQQLFSSSPKLSLCTVARNTENMFSISFRKYLSKKRKTTRLL